MNMMHGQAATAPLRYKAMEIHAALTSGASWIRHVDHAAEARSWVKVSRRWPAHLKSRVLRRRSPTKLT